MLVGGVLFAVLEKPLADPSRHVGWFGTLATFVLGGAVALNGWRRVSHQLTLSGGGFTVVGRFHDHRVPWGRLKSVRRKESTLLLTWDREMFFPVGPFVRVGEIHDLMTALRERAPTIPAEESTRTLRWSSVALASGLVAALLVTLTLGDRWGQSFW